MIKAKHFKIHELVPSETFQKYGEKAWMFLDPNLIILIDALRDEFGGATINNYYWGGNRTASGLRIPTSAEYSVYSQHSHGRAADMLFSNISTSDVRKAIIATPQKWLSLVDSITIEDDVSWLHVDVRNGDNCIKLFKP